MHSLINLSNSVKSNRNWYSLSSQDVVLDSGAGATVIHCCATNNYNKKKNLSLWDVSHKFLNVFQCRYNFFIVLYPAGVAGELLTIYAALPYVKKTGMFSLRLPNKYNVSFDYYYFLIIVMFSYVPCKYYLTVETF